MEIEDDFSLILDYLSRLFAIKRIESIDVHEISVRYVGKSELSDGKEIWSTSFPDIESLDRIMSVTVSISKLRQGEELDLTLAHNEMSSKKSSKEELEKLIEIFDRSTFRFF